MSTGVNRYDCGCCKNACSAAPAIVQDSCGWALDKDDFHADIRATIPDVAEKILWLKKVFAVVKEATWQQDFLCEEAGNWKARRSGTKAGVYHYQEYDPDDDCSLEKTCGGTDTDLDQERLDACADPEDNTLVTDTNWSGTWAWDAGNLQCELDYTGTDIDTDPVSGTLSAHGVLTATTVTAVYSVVAVIGGVIQTLDESWDEEESGGLVRYNVGSSETDFGFTDPYFGYQVTIPTDSTIKYMEVEWELFFTPDGGSEASVVTKSEIWEDGDPSRVFDYEQAYTGFGTFRVGEVRYRCSSVAHWQVMDDPVDTSE